MQLAFAREKIYGEIVKEVERKNFEPFIKDQLIKCIFRRLAPHLKLFKWVENSCFLDSVVVIMLFCKYDFWRKKIYESSIDDEIVKGLFESSTTCKPLRAKLAKKHPEMGLTSYYEAVTTFEIIADHFGMNIPGLKEMVMYPADSLGKERPPYLVYAPISLNDRGEIFFSSKKEHEDYKLVAAIKNTGDHYVCFFESHDGVFYYDDLHGALYMGKIPPGNYELEFFVHKSLLNFF